MEKLDGIINEMNKVHQMLKSEKNTAKKVVLCGKLNDLVMAAKLQIERLNVFCTEEAYAEIILGGSETVDVAHSSISAKERKAEVVKLMKKMRNRGYVYKEIAEHLNEKLIPTFSRRGKWFPQTVHRLLSINPSK